MEHVKTYTPPPVDGLAPTCDTITEISIIVVSVAVEVDLFGLEDSLNLLEITKKNIKDLEQLKSKYEQQLKSELGNASIGRSDKYTVKWTSQTRKSLDTKALIAKYPSLDLEGLYKESTFRKFEVKENK